MADLYTFFDNSNIWIQGKRVSGTKVSPPVRSNARYRIDYGKLLLHVVDGRMPFKEPRLYGSEPPPNDSLWTVLRNKGFDVQVFKRNNFNKEKGLDMKVGLDMQRLIFTEATPGTIALVAGDADYVPVIDELRANNWTVEVWYWSHAAKALKGAADRFESLDKDVWSFGFEA